MLKYSQDNQNDCIKILSFLSPCLLNSYITHKNEVFHSERYKNRDNYQVLNVENMVIGKNDNNLVRRPPPLVFPNIKQDNIHNQPNNLTTDNKSYNYKENLKIEYLKVNDNKSLILSDDEIIQANTEMGYYDECFNQIMTQCEFDLKAARNLLKDKVIKIYDQRGWLHSLWRIPIIVKVGI